MRINLPFDTLPTRKQWQARAKRPGAVGYHARIQLARLKRGEKLLTKIDYPIQTWSFGKHLTLGSLLSPKNTVTLQLAALTRLGRIEEHRVAGEILTRWSRLTPSVRKEALALMLRRDGFTLELLKAIGQGAIKTAHLDASVKTRLLRHKNGKLRRLAEKLLGKISTDRTEVLKAFSPSIAMKGKPILGRNLFQKQCAVCHRVEQMGNAVGPDLTASTDRSPKTLLIALLDPNRNVEERYLNYLATTTGGLTFTGMLYEETAGSITLLDPNGKKQVLLRTELDDLTSTGISLMPEGLEKELSKQDLADLLAYLALAPQRKQFPGNEPVTITPGKDGRIHLLAVNGAIYGKQIRFEAPFRNIGYWHDEQDHVVWRIQLKKAGRYQVLLDYACHPDSAGNRYIFNSNLPLRGKVAGTGGWDQYRRVQIGTFSLEAGLSTLTFCPDGKLERRALLDLRGLCLTPIDSPESGN